MSRLLRYVGDRAGVRDLLSNPDLDSVLLDRAEAIASRARATAPVQTGEYRDSITARTVPGRTRRRAAEVVSSAPHALVVESRTRNLGKAVG